MPYDFATAKADETIPATGWSRILIRLKEEVGENVFAAWFLRIELDHIVDGVAQLSVPTKFLKIWIDDLYLALIISICAIEMPQIGRVLIIVRTAARLPNKSHQDRPVNVRPGKPITQSRRCLAYVVPVAHRNSAATIPLATVIPAVPFAIVPTEKSGLLSRDEIKRIHIKDIQECVATHYNVSRAALLSERRIAKVVQPRQIGIYLARVLTHRSFQDIGNQFLRDHATAIYAYRKIRDRVAKNATFRDEIGVLRQLLQE
jgi:chromosomal replication initiation ATPase DnaA